MKRLGELWECADSFGLEELAVRLRPMSRSDHPRHFRGPWHLGILRCSPLDQSGSLVARNTAGKLLDAINAFLYAGIVLLCCF